MIEGKSRAVRKAKDLEVGDIINFTIDKPAGWRIETIDEPDAGNDFERWFKLKSDSGEDAGYVGYDPDSLIEVVIL